MGDRASHVETALRRLSNILSGMSNSRPVLSAAVDRSGHPDPAAPEYLNCVVVGGTGLSPQDLHAETLRIEKELGRDLREKSLYLPRTIDIDILRLEESGREITVNDSDLIVPHPRLKDRPFLLDAMRELQPGGRPERSR